MRFFETCSVSKTSALHQKIGAKVREIRNKRDISQEKLALKVDLNRAYVGYIERGERKPSVETLAKIARGLGVELFELFKF